MKNKIIQYMRSLLILGILSSGPAVVSAQSDGPIGPGLWWWQMRALYCANLHERMLAIGRQLSESCMLNGQIIINDYCNRLTEENGRLYQQWLLYCQLPNEDED